MASSYFSVLAMQMQNISSANHFSLITNILFSVAATILVSIYFQHVFLSGYEATSFGIKERKYAVFAAEKPSLSI
jgi:hypothetical protein